MNGPCLVIASAHSSLKSTLLFIYPRFQSFDLEHSESHQARVNEILEIGRLVDGAVDDVVDSHQLHLCTELFHQEQVIVLLAGVVYAHHRLVAQLQLVELALHPLLLSDTSWIIESAGAKVVQAVFYPKSELLQEINVLEADCHVCKRVIGYTSTTNIFDRGAPKEVDSVAAGIIRGVAPHIRSESALGQSAMKTAH